MDFCCILVLVLLNACLEENIVRFDQYSSEDSLLDIGLKKKAKSYVREVTPPRKVSPSDPQAGIKSLISPKFQPFYIWTKHSQLYTQIDQYNALSTELLSKSKSTQ